MRFTKMHGCGNDYVYVDCFSEQVNEPGQVAQRVSDRHTGIGSDGLVLIMPSEVADLRMRMFNADGTEAEMCGNASRCVGKYAYEHNLTDKTDLLLETKSGIKRLRLHTVGHEVQSVTVNMGRPVEGETVVHEGRILHTIGMGNPHAVMFVGDLAEVDVHSSGATIEVLPCYPNKTNVEFAEVLSRKEIRLRVWERGTGETMACGTGACATAVAAMNQGLTDNDVTIHLTGGELQISLNDEGEVLMTGPAEEVFTGSIQL